MFFQRLHQFFFIYAHSNQHTHMCVSVYVCMCRMNVHVMCWLSAQKVKLTRRVRIQAEFVAFAFSQIPLGKAWFYFFYTQLWVK